MACPMAPGEVALGEAEKPTGITHQVTRRNSISKQGELLNAFAFNFLFQDILLWTGLVLFGLNLNLNFGG